MFWGQFFFRTSVFVRLFFSSLGLGASKYCKYLYLAHMTLRNPRKYHQIFSEDIPSAVNNNVNACHPSGTALLAWQSWPGNPSLAVLASNASLGHAGLAMLAWPCSPGNAGMAMLCLVMLAWQCWPWPCRSGNAGLAMLAQPSNAGWPYNCQECWPGSASLGNTGPAMLA